MYKKILFLGTLCLSSFTSEAQTIFTQNFEGAMTGWYNEGSVVATQNSINPHGGSKMLMLSFNKEATSPMFNLPSGNKYISFWYNTYFTTSSANYTMDYDVLDAGSSVYSAPYTVNLGFGNTWQFVTKSIPLSAVTTDAQIQFKVQGAFTGPGSNDFRYYIDDLMVTTQNPSSLEENELFARAFKVANDCNESKLVHVYRVEQALGVTCEVYSVNGSMVSNQTVSENSSEKITLDLRNCSSGVYLVRISNGKNAVTKKVII